jgi:hypothetical protein
MADTALNTFLAMEATGSPVEVRQGLGAPGVQPEQPTGVQAEGYPRDLMQLHSRLVRWFEEAETATQEPASWPSATATTTTASSGPRPSWRR